MSHRHRRSSRTAANPAAIVTTQPGQQHHGRIHRAQAEHQLEQLCPEEQESGGPIMLSRFAMIAPLKTRLENRRDDRSSGAAP